MDNLLIAGAAEEEYTASLRWYAERSKRAAEGFEADFRGALESISAHPDRYPPSVVRRSTQVLPPEAISVSSHLSRGGRGSLADCRGRSQQSTSRLLVGPVAR